MKDELFYVYNFISMILYERGRERLSLILQFMVFAILTLIKPLVGSKTKSRIDYRLIFIRRKAFRHPASLLNIRKRTLRVCITYRCNASCEFCYARGLLEEFPKDMSLDDFIYLIKWAKAKGWRRIMFLGGEPTIHPRFEEILNICYSQNIYIYLFTNAFFENKILEKLKWPYVRFVAVNYPLGEIPSVYKKQFLYNLESLSKKEITLFLAGIVDGETDRWRKTIEMAARLKSIVYWSLPLPAYTGKSFGQRIFSDLKVFGSQLLEILKTCAEKNLIYYVCRPIPACIFTSEQWQQVKKMGRYFVFTRCFHGYRGNYAIHLTVNPDLSTYPCSNFFIKGPRINSFKNRASISHYYEGISKDIMSTAPMIECNNCKLYQNFLSLITNKKRLIKERLCDKNVCQAGCVDFRNYKEAIHSCPRLIE